MKVFKILLISCLMLIMAQSFAFAGSGKAIVSYWHTVNNGKHYRENTQINISNITQHDLIIKITLYNYDGTIYDKGEYRNFQNGGTEIGAGKTGMFWLQSYEVTPHQYGYAVIEWKNKLNDDDIVGLVAWTGVAGDSASRAYSIPVNNGKPF
jgi:hypothetical protein